MCNLSEIKSFFKPKLRQIGVSMVIAGIMFWAGWMQFGDTDHPIPIIIAWNMLLGGTGMLIGEVVAQLLLRSGIVKRKNGDSQTPDKQTPDKRPTDDA